jgi:hypothetical protein
MKLMKYVLVTFFIIFNINTVAQALECGQDPEFNRGVLPPSGSILAYQSFDLPGGLDPDRWDVKFFTETGWFYILDNDGTHLGCQNTYTLDDGSLITNVCLYGKLAQDPVTVSIVMDNYNISSYRTILRGFFLTYETDPDTGWSVPLYLLLKSDFDDSVWKFTC